MSDIAWTLAGLAVIAGTWLWGTAADRRAVRRDAAAIRRVMLLVREQADTDVIYDYCDVVLVDVPTVGAP